MILSIAMHTFIGYGIWLNGGVITNIVIGFIIIMSMMQIVAAYYVIRDDTRVDELIVVVKIRNSHKWRVYLFRSIDGAILLGLAAQAWWVIFIVYFIQAACAYAAELHVEES